MTNLEDPRPATDRLADFDFETHNAEVRTLYQARSEGRAYRIPIIVGTNTRYFMLSPEANPEMVDFHHYSESPEVMFRLRLQFNRWSRFNILQDSELGIPDAWEIGVDLQNYYDAAWFGCPIEYCEGEVPDTRAIYADQPERLLEKGLPDPFGGVMARGLEYYELFQEMAKQQTYCDLPIRVGWPGFGLGTDGPFTCACNLFGPSKVCLMLASEPDRIQTLLEFITDAIIHKMSAWRTYMNIPFPADGFGTADDSIALISTAMYRKHILPLHRRLYDTFGTKKDRSIHLCGNSSRHFKTIVEELSVNSFDTGFPIDFGRLRKELGPNIQIQGGPHVELVRNGSPAEICEETERILRSGILEGGRFVLREGNNLAPGTPLENTEAMYHAGRRLGKLADGRPQLPSESL